MLFDATRMIKYFYAIDKFMSNYDNQPLAKKFPTTIELNVTITNLWEVLR